MRTKHSEIGVHNGRRYLLVHSRMCDEGAWESKTWRWFLSVDDEFQGDYKTKREAMADINP